MQRPCKDLISELGSNNTSPATAFQGSFSSCRLTHHLCCSRLQGVLQYVICSSKPAETQRHKETKCTRFRDVVQIYSDDNLLLVCRTADLEAPMACRRLCCGYSCTTLALVQVATCNLASQYESVHFHFEDAKRVVRRGDFPPVRRLKSFVKAWAPWHPSRGRLSPSRQSISPPHPLGVSRPLLQPLRALLVFATLFFVS